MTKDEIIAALPKLSKPHLKEIQALISKLLGSEENENSRLWFEALSAALGSKQPYNKAVQTVVGKHLNQHAQAAEDYLTSIGGKNSTRKLDHAASRRFMAELMVDDMKRRRVTPTIGMLATNLGRLHEIMESAFPGYVSNNLTHLIFRRKT